MSTGQAAEQESNSTPLLLTYLTSEEKHKLVGSFVIEDFWDTFNVEFAEPISRFRGLAKESIPDFIDAYQDMWDFVVEVNRLDDIFVSSVSEKRQNPGKLTLAEIKTGFKLLGLSLYSELEKDCLMALNKSITLELAYDLKEKYQFDDEEFQLLITPSFETFFAKYNLDHLEYSIVEDPEARAAIERRLVEDYHANDPDLFRLRFAGMYMPGGEVATTMLATNRSKLEENAQKKLAFIGDNQELQSFEKLLEYDHFLDFKYRYNLEACPEYYVRKLLFGACQSEGLFVGVSSPMVLKDREFLDGVGELIRVRESLNSYDTSAELISVAGLSMVTQANFAMRIQKLTSRCPYLDTTDYQRAIHA